MIIAVSIVSLTTSYSQQFEQGLFNMLCKKINEQNSAYLLRTKLKGTHVLEDPVSGEQSISYGSDSKMLDDFKTLPKNQQLDVLKAPDLPIFPIKDTLLILDQCNFFTNGFHFKTGNVFFVTDDKIGKTKSQKYLKLNLIGARDNSLILSFSTPQSKEFFNFHFGIKAGDISFIKWSRVDQVPSKE
jgi:hypothetical protein